MVSNELTRPSTSEAGPTGRTVQPALAAYGSLAMSMTIVGSSVVTSKYITDSMPVFLASAMRFLIAAAILGLWTLVERRRGTAIPRVSGRDHLILALQAFTGVFMFNVLLLYGLRLTTATASGILTSATPVVIAVGAGMLGERLTGRVWMGVMLAMTGVAAANLFGAGGGESLPSNPLLGALLVSGAVVGEALYTILGKMVANRLPPVTIATWVTVYGTMMFLVPGVWQLRGFEPEHVPAAAWLSVGYSATFVTVIAFVLWFRGLQRVPASTAAPFTGMIPIAAVVFAGILLHEPVGWPHVAGIVGVIGGILLITNGTTRSPVAAPTP